MILRHLMCLCVWAWSSPALAQTTAGCHNGRLEDPVSYVFAHIDRRPGQPAPDIVDVLTRAGFLQGPEPGIKAGEAHFGITQQIAADGPRGVLFLPTDTPDENGYFTRQILLVNERAEWAWIERFPRRPAYAPRACGSASADPVLPPVSAPAPPLPSTDLSPILTQMAIHHSAVMAELAAIRTDIADFRAAVRSRWLAFINSPIVKYGTMVAAGVLAKWGFDRR